MRNTQCKMRNAHRVKMAVFDLDRTLLHSDKTISTYSAQTLNGCRQKGIKIVFATARPIRTVKPFFSIFQPDAVVCHNGAVILFENGRIQKTSINPQDAKKILSDIEKLFPHATLSAEIEDVLYANFDVSIHWDNISAKQTDFSDLSDVPVDKIIVGVSSPRQVEAIAALLPKEVYIELSDGKLGLMMNRAATKLNGITAVLQDYDISLAQTVAFGDDINDIEMLQACGIGVAVGNALDEVKAVADVVCETNENDGPARWLGKIVGSYDE